MLHRTISAAVTTNGNWPEVTNSNPCPICTKDHRCKVAPDGNAVCCFRLQQAPTDWQVSKQHAEGATFVREGGALASSRRKSAKQKSAPLEMPRLSSERIHEAYSLLIEKLVLFPWHGSRMLDRGMSVGEIERREYRSMQPRRSGRVRISSDLADELGSDFEAVPGFGFNDGKPVLYGAKGMLIPVRNVHGQIVAIIIRSDNDEKNKYTLLSSRKYGGNSPGSP